MIALKNSEIADLLSGLRDFFIRMLCIVRPHEGLLKHTKDCGLPTKHLEIIEAVDSAIDQLRQNEKKIPRFYCFMKWVKENQHENETFAQLFLNGVPACLHENEESGGKWQAAIKRTLNALRMFYGEETYNEMGRTEKLECD